MSDNISNPVFYNRTTQQYFKVNINMTDGDIVKITTTKKNKTVTLLRGSEERNIIDLMAEGSEWIVFSPYENEVSYSADSGATNLLVTVTVTKLVEGV